MTLVYVAHLLYKSLSVQFLQDHCWSEHHPAPHPGPASNFPPRQRGGRRRPRRHHDHRRQQEGDPDLRTQLARHGARPEQPEAENKETRDREEEGRSETQTEKGREEVQF